MRAFPLIVRHQQMLPARCAAIFIRLFLVFVTVAPMEASSIDGRPVKGLVEVHDEANAIPLAHAVDRLRACSPVSLDMINGLESHIPRAPYAFTILLGVTGTDSELKSAWGNNTPTAGDAWALKTISTSPLVIAATGERPRGVLYAAYRLADLLKLGRDLSDLNEVHSPLIPMREAAVCATEFEGRERHSEYMATLNELPRYGVNGVMVVPGMWRVALGPGCVYPPVEVDKNGDVCIDEKKQLDWLNFLGTIKSYDLNVTLYVEPIVPPAYTKELVAGFYKTGQLPPQYLEVLATFYRRYLEVLLDALPYVDAITLTPGIEAMASGYGNAQTSRMFLQGQNLATCASLMKVYLDTASKVALERGKKVLFWDHQWGSATDDQVALTNQLSAYPDIIRIGEDYWPNELWPNGGTKLPDLMDYLPSDARAKWMDGSFGILSINDAEDFGGGSMPCAFADPFVYTAGEMVRHKAAYAVSRLNECDHSLYGTLWDVVEIQFLQESNGMWTNARTPEQVWEEWVERHYGKAAAPLVSSALARSGAIIRDGFSVNGLNLLFHSYLTADRWHPGGGLYQMFGVPGTSLLPRGPQGSISSWDQIPAQLQLHATSIDDFHQHQSVAMQAVMDALSSIDKASPLLSLPDYGYLHGIFANAQSALRVFSALGEMACAANLTENNYAKVDNPKVQFEKSAAAVESLAADPSIRTMDFADSRHHDIQKDLRQILQEYRNYVNKHVSGAPAL